MSNMACSYIVRTGLPDVECTRKTPYLVCVKAGGSSHALPRCKTHIGRTATSWLDIYGRGVVVTVEVAGRG